MIAVILALFVRTWVVQAFKIPTGSMENNLLIGDHLLVNKFVFGPTVTLDRALLPVRDIRRGDIVVFKYPEEPERDFIKRVIGLPGDTVELRAKKVHVNGQPLDEPYVHFLTPASDVSEVTSMDVRERYGPVTVPADQYFVMGDNRDNSQDSRYWGFLPRSYVKGKAMMIYWSVRVGSRRLRRQRVRRDGRQAVFSRDALLHEDALGAPAAPDSLSRRDLGPRRRRRRPASFTLPRLISTFSRAPRRPARSSSSPTCTSLEAFGLPCASSTGPSVDGRAARAHDVERRGDGRLERVLNPVRASRLFVLGGLGHPIGADHQLVRLAVAVDERLERRVASAGAARCRRREGCSARRRPSRAASAGRRPSRAATRRRPRPAPQPNRRPASAPAIGNPRAAPSRSCRSTSCRHHVPGHHVSSLEHAGEWRGRSDVQQVGGIAAHDHRVGQLAGLEAANVVRRDRATTRR